MAATALAPEHTDLSNAKRFISDHGETIRYCQAKGKWLVWDENRWRWDDTEAVVAMAQQTVEAMLAEAMKNNLYQQRLADAKHAINSGSRARIDAMLFLARPHLSVRVEELDADPLLFNVANGTLDLRTGELKPHNPAQLITKLSPVIYDQDADCPTWIEFLNDITSADLELAGYLQRAAGYTLTGETCEHSFFMLYGSGTNGKSTFIETMRYVFGDYARVADFSTFMQQRSTTAPRNDLAMLAGARLVTATESDDGNHLAESFVKQITGGDKVTARFLYGEHFEFNPSFKLWLSTNHKPTIRGTDEGIWRRIRLVPFMVRIANDKIDRHLKDSLKPEAAGILGWAIEGLRRYQADGLKEPACVRKATSEYRNDEDPVGKFLSARCEMQPAAKTKSRTLYDAFKEWAVNNSERLIDARKFAALLAERGLKSTRMTSAVFWQGINLAECREM